MMKKLQELQPVETFFKHLDGARNVTVDIKCYVLCCLEKKRVEISYVGLVHTALPTNTNFQLTFLLIRLLEALFEDLPV